MGKRTCGCGERGRHKPTCNLTSVRIVQIHEEELAVENKLVTMTQIYNKYYGKPPELAWSFTKKRQAVVEKRIIKLVNKLKPFYLTVTTPEATIEEWFIDGGNWVSAKQTDGKYRGLVGHIKNLLPFIKGRSLFSSGKAPKQWRRK